MARSRWSGVRRVRSIWPDRIANGIEQSQEFGPRNREQGGKRHVSLFQPLQRGQGMHARPLLSLEPGQAAGRSAHGCPVPARHAGQVRQVPRTRSERAGSRWNQEGRAEGRNGAAALPSRQDRRWIA